MSFFSFYYSYWFNKSRIYQTTDTEARQDWNVFQRLSERKSEHASSISDRISISHKFHSFGALQEEEQEQSRAAVIETRVAPTSSKSMPSSLLRIARYIAVSRSGEDLFGDTGARMQKFAWWVVRLSNERDHLLMEDAAG